MSITIETERPDTPEAIALINELEEILSAEYPPEDRYGYSVQKLIEQKVQFYVIRVGGEAAGCGGIQIYASDGEPAYGELKRMFVRPAFRRRGLANALLQRLAAYAAEVGVSILRLETGTAQTEAIQLYERFGFYAIGPFGDYQSSDNNIFYEMRI